MAKEKIPVYTISNLAAPSLDPSDFMIEDFGPYLGRHSPHLHHAHRHNFYHLVYFRGGKGKHSIDFTQFPVEAGQVYFMTPGQVHSWNFEGVPTGYVVNFSEGFLKSFLLDANYLDRFSFFSGNATDSVVRLTGPVQEKVAGLLGEMTEEYRASAAADLFRAQLVQLFLWVQSGIASGRPALPAAATQKQQVMGSFRKLLDQNYKTMRLPSEYAALLFVTPNHLNVLSRHLLGRSAGEVIRDRVLLEAKRLLTNAGMTGAQIADELNFQDNSYFNRFFKKYEGVTPEEFRRKHAVK
ncbi:MAG TPA: helix-turn-helix transcriptional regulator [Puia sp.]|uniref:AraC family transcriptional regulator n=1 Tax=Puia sp. TaxID=2045100 RepID=UPI002C4FBE75|nr:helix-turn-helix transcriptional regulator [Puia sp.]HVU98669.1 helix-turn-helix transcriptional regulator [Puia sp.]